MTGAPLRLEFVGSQGDQLAARLDLPAQPARAFALFAHCFTCSKDVLAAARISRALTESGIAVLRFDFTGLGQSGGEFANSNFSSNIDDIIRAADYLREHYRAPSILIGHSLGGAAVLAAAGRIPETKAVVTIGAPADPKHIVKLMATDISTIEEFGSAEVNLGGRPFTIQRQFLRDLETHSQDDRIAHLGAALLVLHSPTDQTVSIDNARHIFDAARHPKSFVALDGADHLLTGRDDAQFTAEMIGLWAERYASEIPIQDSSAAPATLLAGSPRNAFPLETGLVRVGESGAGPFGQTVAVGRHHLIADEPEPIGSDTGPSPYDYVLAGLGACTSMTIRMYADRKKWPLEHVSVELRYSRIHAEDCASCDTSAARVDHIDRQITLRGQLTADQKIALLAIADKCPVHRTLHAGVHVTTALADPNPVAPLPVQ